MAKMCPLCSKSSLVGGGYSNRTRATQFNPTGKRRRKPNLQWARLSSGPSSAKATAGKKRIKICTKCLKANKHLAVR